MGFSIFLIFVSTSSHLPFLPTDVAVQLSLINYTVDAYLFAAASALAASTVSRSIFGAVFPVCISHTFPGLYSSTL